MSYGLKYSLDFANKVTSYTLEISEKDFSGDPTDVKGYNPAVVHSWQEDNPKGVIKGSSLAASLVNEGGLPLDNFYSVNDDQFKGKLIWHAALNDITLFEGFVVQDNSDELMVDFAHDINLTLTDNLGLLKDIPFDKAPYQGEADFYILRSALSFIHSCISATGLELNTRIFANINEITQDDSVCFLEQTLLNPQVFLTNEKWDDCYTVLTKILERWNLSLFQVKGVWNIVRWDELRYNDYSIPGFLYDEDFVFVGTTPLDEGAGMFAGWDKFLIGIGETSVAEQGLRRRINRPFKFQKEIFNYRQPDQFLRNFDLQQLGAIQNGPYADGANTVTEYDFTWWSYTDAFPSASGVNGAAAFFIRVVRDALGNEIERYAVTKNNDIHSYPIEANAGDIVTFSFSCKTPDPFTTIGIFVRLTDGSTTKFAHGASDNPSWDTTTGSVTVNNTDPDQWFNVDFSTGEIPFDGLLTVYLRSLATPASSENWYRDIRLEYIAVVNQSTKIIGQTHKNEQDESIKNNEERTIFIDTSPRNFIVGTLFLDSTTGVLQDRATQWIRKGETESRNLGDIITFESLFLRRLPRTQLEDTFHGVLSKGQAVGPSTIYDHISLISVMRYTFFTTLNFIFGRLEIDYPNNKFTGGLYEMYEDSETDADLTADYEFKFLYDNK